MSERQDRPERKVSHSGILQLWMIYDNSARNKQEQCRNATNFGTALVRGASVFTGQSISSIYIKNFVEAQVN